MQQQPGGVPLMTAPGEDGRVFGYNAQRISLDPAAYDPQRAGVEAALRGYADRWIKEVELSRRVALEHDAYRCQRRRLVCWRRVARAASSSMRRAATAR
jgi:hypothetical protein